MNEQPRPEYPRPLLQRADWLNLNGPWRFCCDDEGMGLRHGWHQALPGQAENITVPFAPNSAASGITGVRTDTTVWYERDFELPADWQEKRICLRFGAVDHTSQVFINGTLVGEHTGCYSPFGLDINHALVPGTNTISVRAQDSLS